MFKCLLWKRTAVTIYVSENYLCVLEDRDVGQEKGLQTVVPWKEVSAIKRRRCLARDTAISIRYTNQDGAEAPEIFVYGFLNRDEVAGVLEQSWNGVMGKLLRSAELNSSLAEDSVHSTSGRRQSISASRMRSISVAG